MMRRKAFRLKLPSRTLLLGERTLVMGVLNVTPDSFSDGGQFLDATRAIEHALAIVGEQPRRTVADRDVELGARRAVAERVARPAAAGDPRRVGVRGEPFADARPDV